jgi:hypothetical protein
MRKKMGTNKITHFLKRKMPPHHKRKTILNQALTLMAMRYVLISPLFSLPKEQPQESPKKSPVQSPTKITCR